MRKLYKRIINALLSRFSLICLLIILQLFLFFIMALNLNKKWPAMCAVLSIVLTIGIMNSKATDTHKLAWIVPILLLPGFGGLFYLILGLQRAPKRQKNKILRFKGEITRYMNKARQPFSPPPNSLRVANYLESNSYPAYKNTSARYFSEATSAFEEILKTLARAGSYIFLESFIIESGWMWSEILKILEEKVSQGVEVRIIYDDFGCINKLPFGYFKTLRKSGIQCHAFNRLPLFVNSFMNNRDHRKLIIVDGETAFVNGFNIGDEYINKASCLGHWKDNCILIAGEAVTGLVSMFLQMWNLHKRYDIDLGKYIKPTARVCDDATGFVQPFGSGPLSSKQVYENVYLNLINCARREVCVFTPYFIPSNEFLNACKNAAQSGIDVKIVYPGIHDKWYTNLLSRSYFLQALKAGVNIYEYSPGFIHAKSMLVDGTLGVVGTANIDYRSFYSQFEIGVVMFETEAVRQFANDCKETLECCRKITIDDCTNARFSVRLITSFLKLFRPLF
ncbi:MAG: cardiolipin synthase [Oscillospiraceae bacterium]|jgi:cardiolipin synthase|nr:cardiolipin synthase [Oscillospiraceae bacterium]